MHTFFSKLLLFGEHTINLGSPALAIPLHLFSGHWVEENGAEKQQNLPAYATYLEDLARQRVNIFSIDTQKMKSDLENGLHFQSSAPCGYGVGSSGILTAAVYDRYGINKLSHDFLNFHQLKKGFAQMECFFHGTSSGIDPLIAYLNEPLLITNEGITTVSLPQYLHKGNTIFLIDTHVERKAEPLIQWFMHQITMPDVKNKLITNLVEFNKAAINAFLEGHWPKLMQSCHQISQFQFDELSHLIPENYQDIWKKGLENDVYKLKICGAGGGGFIMGVTSDIANARTLLQHYDVVEVFP